MLVATLENVAKKLIDMLDNTSYKYHKIHNPKEIDSDPPTPIAAPLPEYFSYEAKDLTQKPKSSISLDYLSKVEVVQKLLSLQDLNSSKITQTIKN